MTQIKGTFEGCGEAPAPLKLNEVFISHADSTLNTARSRAVTVNVSLQSIRCLFSLANGPERTKGQTFSCYFSCISLAQSLHFSHLEFPQSYLLLLYHHPPAKKSSPPTARGAPSRLSSGRKPVYCGFLLDLEATQRG